MVDKNEDSPEVRKQFTEIQKAKDLEQIGGNSDSSQSQPGYAEGLASAQEAAEKRRKSAKEKGAVINLGADDTALPSGVGASSNENLSPAEQARLEKERTAGKSPRGTKTGILRPGTAPKPVRRKGNINEGTAGENNIERLQKGMGIAGQENGEIEEAHNIRLRKHKEGTLRETPILNDQGGNAAGSHEHRLVKVMTDLGVTEEALKSDPFDTGMNTENRVDAMHAYVQAARDIKAEPVRELPQAGEFWEHPVTKQIHAVEENHPDMPKVFERNKGMSFTYSRNRQGQITQNRGVYEGWNREKSSGGAGGTTVWRKRSVPENSLGNVVDLLRKAYQNPDTANLKASGAYGLGRTLLGAVNGVSTRVARAIPNVTGRRNVDAVGPFTEAGASVSNGEPVQLVEPLKDRNSEVEAGEGQSLEGVLPPKTKRGRVLAIGMESSGIPEGRTGTARVRRLPRLAPAGLTKKSSIANKEDREAAAKKAADAKTAARRGNLFKGPRPEEYDGQLAFDFRPTGEGPSPQFRGVSSASKVERDAEGMPLPPRPGYKQSIVSKTGTRYVTVPRTEEVGREAATGGVGPAQTPLRTDVVHPDVHTVINLPDTTPVARNPIAEGRPSGKPILPKYDEKNEVVEGTGTKGGNGYEQPALPGFEVPVSPHSKGAQWDDLLGGKVVEQAARGVGRTTSQER